jgi:hexulose-6-phosphate isomerase
MKRRDFLKNSAGVLALAALTPNNLVADEATAVSASTGKRKIRKAVMWGTLDGLKGSVLEKMKAIKEAGFAGTEMMSHMNQDEVLRARDETGLIIPSVCGQHHWGKPLSDPNPKVREEGVDALKQTLRDAKRYGATSVLLVPAVVTKDVSYADAYTRSQAEIAKAVPLAEELGVKIAIENVWNHFLLSPLEAARFVDEFKSPAVGWHFDIGNVLNFGWPDQWIRILGKRIQKLHVKEYSLKKRDAEGPYKGFQVALGEGSNNWPAIMKALDDIAYDGWGIAEQGGPDSLEALQDLSKRMDKVFAG